MSDRILKETPVGENELANIMELKEPFPKADTGTLSLMNRLDQREKDH